MKILWVVNNLMPEIAKTLGRIHIHGGGWLVSMSEDIVRHEGQLLKLYIVTTYDGRAVIIKTIKDITYILVPERFSSSKLKHIIDSIEPDVIHLHGTEKTFGYKIMEACPSRKYVVSIQGIVGICALHYMAYLPCEITKVKKLRDYFRNSTIIQGQRNFEKAGEIEKKIFDYADCVIGRTRWDKACLSYISPNARYEYCSENLRSIFYTEKWNISNCTLHTIFTSQGNYPIKGLHLLIQALPLIVKKYPDTKLIVAGKNIVEPTSFVSTFKQSTYGRHLRQLINKLKLSEHIVFTGELNEEEMCSRMLSSHVFVLPSSIENSPNSLGEAMILGLPCVCSNVGGVSDMLEDHEEGYLYPADEYYMIPYYVDKIFSSDDQAQHFSNTARKHALKTHNRLNNYNKLKSIYSKLLKDDRCSL